ncbi:hypothetical protein FOA43_003392 [Brettanomyces nanus]|uniref:Uncharacterized protein n=1 Tax=Eeniella nana TaxID=13502 RepID=A0A875S3W2_EENNA|nr:uncharacterized protein FOA43_003392 [Brettanomyces nanus]QPG76006.1 hypothetical protein FOA43_003392 [Brettanomyces nanus]
MDVRVHVREESGESVTASQQSSSTVNTNTNSLSSSGTASSSSAFSTSVPNRSSGSPVSSMDTTISPGSVETDRPKNPVIAQMPLLPSKSGLKVTNEKVTSGPVANGKVPAKREKKRSTNVFKKLFRRIFGSSSSSHASTPSTTNQKQKEKSFSKKSSSVLDFSKSRLVKDSSSKEKNSVQPCGRAQIRHESEEEEEEEDSSSIGPLTVDLSSENSSFNGLLSIDLLPKDDEDHQSLVHSLKLQSTTDIEKNADNHPSISSSNIDVEVYEPLGDLGTDVELDYLSTIIGLGETSFFKSDNLNVGGDESVKSADGTMISRRKSMRIKSMNKKRSLSYHSVQGAKVQKEVRDLSEVPRSFDSYYKHYKSRHFCNDGSDFEILTEGKPKEPLVGAKPLRSCLNPSSAHYKQSQYDPRFNNGYISGRRLRPGRSMDPINRKKTRSVKFSHKISLNETHAPGDYERYNIRMKQMYSFLATHPQKVRSIRHRLNDYKKYEMHVHELSKRYTHFFHN